MKAKPSPSKAPAGAKKSKADETGKRAARKSATNEHRARSSSRHDDEQTATHETVITEVRAPQPTPPAAVVNASEADSWPTETSDPTAENQVYGQQRTRVGPAFKEQDGKAKPIAAQAVRVVLWRGPDGVLRVAPQGTSVSAVTMEAVLVALEPDADLLAWLSH